MLGRLRPEDYPEFKVRLGYRVFNSKAKAHTHKASKKRPTYLPRIQSLELRLVSCSSLCSNPAMLLFYLLDSGLCVYSRGKPELWFRGTLEVEVGRRGCGP